MATIIPLTAALLATQCAPVDEWHNMSRYPNLSNASLVLDVHDADRYEHAAHPAINLMRHDLGARHALAYPCTHMYEQHSAKQPGPHAPSIAAQRDRQPPSTNSDGVRSVVTASAMLIIAALLMATCGT